MLLVGASGTLGAAGVGGMRPGTKRVVQEPHQVAEPQRSGDSP